MRRRCINRARRKVSWDNEVREARALIINHRASSCIMYLDGNTSPLSLPSTALIGKVVTPTKVHLTYGFRITLSANCPQATATKRLFNLNPPAEALITCYADDASRNPTHTASSPLAQSGITKND